MYAEQLWTIAPLAIYEWVLDTVKLYTISFLGGVNSDSRTSDHFIFNSSSVSGTNKAILSVNFKSPAFTHWGSLYSLSDLSGGGTFNEVKTTSGSIGLEAYGLTQDWNYSKSQYNGNLDTYNEFINSIGGEENCENVNYILYKYAYEPAGFNWGGNYQRKGNSGTFNPKRFEIKY